MNLSLLHEMSLSDYHAQNFPVWIALIPGEELMTEFICDDQECDGAIGACKVRVYRKMRMAA